MSPAHQRGVLLLQQGRFELADREFRQDLAQDPDNPLSHAYLALCLNRGDRHDEALREADEAVRCAPDLAFTHYVRGVALQGSKRLAEAEAAAREATRLDPEDADYPSLLASIAMARRDWKAALAASDRGLALDPEHANCLNLRAMALVQLGRKDEAARTLGSALADDPENALTHANQGWALLHRGDHKQALEHFREALRIDPDMEWARVGIVEALKARFLVYRLMLGFFLWMGRQSSVAQWAVILGLVFGRQILASVARSAPGLAPFIRPILVLTFAFVLMTWISSPLFNLALRFNRFGRLALSREQKVQSNWIGACFFLAAVLFAVKPRDGQRPGLPRDGVFRPPPVPARGDLPARIRAAPDAGGGLCRGRRPAGPRGLRLALHRAGRPPGEMPMEPATLFQSFFLGAMLSTWLGAFLGRGITSR